MSIQAPFLRRISSAHGPASEQYPFDIPLIQNGFDLEIDRPVTIICGENGSGKSTIIEAIALHCGFSVTGGSRNHNTGGATSDVEPLLKQLRFSWALKIRDGFFMRAESFYEFSSKIDALAREPDGPSIYRAYGGRSLHAQSHGEAFMSLFANRLGRRGLYLMDEPEAALSPQRQLALLGIIHELERSRQAQLVIATHSPMIMAYPGAALMYIDDGQLVERNFKATLHFQILARFFDNPEKYIGDFLAS